MGLIRSTWTAPTIRATVTVGGTTTPAIDISGAAIGMVYVPSTFDGTVVSFTLCDTESGTFVALEDALSAAVTVSTAASQAFAIPESVFGARWMKLVCTSTQTTTDTVFAITLKG